MSVADGVQCNVPALKVHKYTFEIFEGKEDVVWKLASFQIVVRAYFDSPVILVTGHPDVLFCTTDSKKKG